jgi:hypothetical protein
MLRKVFTIPIIIALLVVMSVTGLACGAAKEGELPTREVGNQWVYRWVENATEYTFTQKVTGEEMVESKNCYAMDWLFEPPRQGMSTMKYWIDKKTLNSFSKMRSSGEYDGHPYTGAMIFSYEVVEGSYWPLEIGKEFRMEGTETTTVTADGQVVSSDTKTVTYIGEVEKKEEIEVPAGKFSCFKLVMTDGDGNLVSRSWYSDKVKSEVKSIAYSEDGGVTYTMELKSYSA